MIGDDCLLLPVYQMLWIYVLYSFLGWCTEVVFVASNTGKFVNRGFLNGPVCPIYGWGVLFVVLCLTPLKDNFAALFLGSVLLTSLLEFVTGFVLEKFFGDKWWDYSDQPFNIKGYVCLKFSLLWGVACVLVMSAVQPMIMGLITGIPASIGNVLLVVILLAFAADTVITVTAAVHMKVRLRVMNELAARLTAMSNMLGEPLADGALEVKGKLTDGALEVKERLADGAQDAKEMLDGKRREFEEAREKLTSLAQQRGIVQARLLKSFPRLQTGRNRDTIEQIKQFWKSKRN